MSCWFAKNARIFVFGIKTEKKRPPKKRAALYRKISVLKSVSADAAVRLICARTSGTKFVGLLQD